MICSRCGREVEWSEGAGCYVAPSQALPPACGRSVTGDRYAIVRGHAPLSDLTDKEIPYRLSEAARRAGQELAAPETEEEPSEGALNRMNYPHYPDV